MEGLNVPRIVPSTVRRFAQHEGLDVEALFRGLDRRVFSKGMHWDECAELFTRLDRARPDAIARFAEFYVTKFAPVSVLASYLVSVEGVYRFLFFAWPRLWPMLGLRSERTKTGWILRARLDEERRGSAAFFRLVGEVLRSCPRMVGKQDAVVESTISDRSAEWRVRPSAATTDGAGDDLPPQELFAIAHHEMFGPLEQLALTVPAEWGLTPAEERVVTMIASGKTIDDVGKSLDVGRETVRTHVKRAMSKAGVHRQTELLTLLYRPR
jgi:DNA-binding CsgD family transcriptional regulator